MKMADLFRAAAARLNADALTATPPPWYALDNGDRLVHVRPDGEIEYVVDEPMTNPDNAKFIAMMDPGVATRLAHLFTVHANMLDAAGGEERFTSMFAATELRDLALAVLDWPDDPFRGRS